MPAIHGGLHVGTGRLNLYTSSMKDQSLTSSPFTPPLWLRNPHLQTVWPTLFRKLDFEPDVT